jgi:hypothetical protein
MISVSSITKTSSSTPSRSSLGRRCRTFTRNHDKCKVMFLDLTEISRPQIRLW